MAAVGFEPTPPKRLVPKTSALDRSATLPHDLCIFRQVSFSNAPTLRAELTPFLSFSSRSSSYRQAALFSLYGRLRLNAIF